MSPEVSLSQPYNCKAEVYSFSMILWQLLSHARPFEGVTASTFIDRVAKGGERPKVDPAWPEGLRTLLEQCWNTDPALRPHFKELHPRLEELCRAATPAPTGTNGSQEEVGSRGPNGCCTVC